MITPTELTNLNVEEQQRADAAESFIDKTIQTAYDKNPAENKFVISTSKLSKEVDGLSIKVRCHVVDQFTDQVGALLSTKKTRDLTFNLPRKRKAKTTTEVVP